MGYGIWGIGCRDGMLFDGVDARSFAGSLRSPALVPSLRSEEAAVVSCSDAAVDFVSGGGMRVVIAVPFSGDGTWFRIMPESYPLMRPRAWVGKDELRFTYLGID